MFRLVCIPALLLASAVSIAQAQPNPGTSTLPSVIRLVGYNSTPAGDVVDPVGQFTVTVRTAASVPIPGAVVQINFGTCTQVAPSAVQAFPGVTLMSCAPPIVSAVTNGAGVATFRVTGSVLHRAPAGGGVPCASIGATDGGPLVTLGTVRVAAYDQDGVNGVDPNDWGLFICDRFGGVYNTRSDYNGSGTIDGVDAALFAQGLVAGGSTSTGARCDLEPSATAKVTSVGGLNLAWNTCRGMGGAGMLILPCNSNLGSSTLIGSFVAPPGIDVMHGIENLTGFEAELDIISDDGIALPDWWSFQPGGCREGSLTAVSGFSMPVGCANAWPAVGTPAVASQITYPDPITGRTNWSKIKIIGTFSQSGIAATPGTEYDLFRIDIDNQLTVGPPVCAGCGSNVAVRFTSLKLTQPPTAGDPACGSPALTSGIESHRPPAQYLMFGAGANGIAFANGIPGGFPPVAVPEFQPLAVSMSPAVPNPVRDETTFLVSLPRETRVAMVVYDLAGRVIRRVLDGRLPAGEHRVRWDRRDDQGRKVPNAVYLCRLRAEARTVSRSVVAVD